MGFSYVILSKYFCFQDLVKLRVFVCIFVFLFFVSFFLFKKATFNWRHETNLGLRPNLNSHFNICHWSLKSISAHNFAKVQLQKAYLAVHRFEIICLSETYLNFSFPFDDDNLDICSYIMVRADNQANSKGGVAYTYYKICLPLRVLDVRFLHERTAFELRISDKLCSFIFLYRSSNQSYDDFVLFYIITFWYFSSK